ncbi:MAG: hypothetical protein IKE41_04960, partial [Clostridia bacterium]|nr:hypothetical protein [Clostridia bacterium]
PDDLLEKTKSRDWKKLEKNVEIPHSAQEMRARSVVAAHHFGQVAGGADSSKPKVDYQINDKVSHPVFGEGVIMKVNPTAGDSIIDIKFDDKNVGDKTLLANYANLTKLS